MFQPGIELIPKSKQSTITREENFRKHHLRVEQHAQNRNRHALRVVGQFDLPARGSVTRSYVCPPEVQDHSTAFWRQSMPRVTDPRAHALGCTFASFPNVTHYRQGF